MATQVPGRISVLNIDITPEGIRVPCIMMIEHRAGMGQYVVYAGEECFIFHVPKDGNGFFCCAGLAKRHLDREGKNLFRGPLELDPDVRARLEHLEEEFKFPVPLDPVLTKEIWDLNQSQPSPMPSELARRHLVLNAALGYIALCRCAIGGVDLNQAARRSPEKVSFLSRFRKWRDRAIGRLV